MAHDNNGWVWDPQSQRWLWEGDGIPDLDTKPDGAPDNDNGGEGYSDAEYEDLWKYSKDKLGAMFGFGDEYDQYIPEYDDTLEQKRYGSDNDGQIDSQFEAKMAALQNQKDTTQSLWGQQQKGFNLQRDTIQESFDIKQQQTLQSASNKMEQYGQKLQAQQMSGLGGNNSILSQASKSQDLMSGFDRQMANMDTKENLQLDQIDLQEDEAGIRFDSKMKGFDIQEKSMNIGRDIGKEQMHQDYEDRLYDRLWKIKQMEEGG